MSDEHDENTPEEHEWEEVLESAASADILVEAADDADELELHELPEVLPVLPLKNTVLFPHLVSPLLVNTARSQLLIDEVILDDNRLMVCSAVRKAGAMHCM